MKRLLLLAVLFLLVGGIGVGVYLNRDVEAGIETKENGEEPDMPGFLHIDEDMKADFMARRAEQISMLRGVEKDKPFDPQQRIDAIAQMEQQRTAQMSSSNPIDQESLAAAWTAIGPAPIPNGQTNGVSTPVSGRTISIAVHPTNASIVYVGTAQGGLYRSTDGGTNWTPLLDNAFSLAIGAIAISPSQPDTIYVGTGEPHFSLDSFFGAGLYRIDNASTGTPTITGPLGTFVFAGRAISEIQVSPTDANTIFVSTTSGLGGISGAPSPTLPARGVYRSTDALAAAPTFARLSGLAPAAGASVRDIILDPLNPNFLVANVVAAGGVGGIYVSTDALAAAPTFAQRVVFTSTSTSELTAEFAIQHTAGAANPTVYAATGNGGGRVLINTDGGTTWTQQISNGFCGGQCFYDIAVNVDPTNPARVYLGGTGAVTFAFSNTSGTSFTSSQNGLHTDSHVITVAPSTPSTIYFGSDGGIYRSVDSGANWTSLSNTQFFATQFIGLDVHPTDTNFTLGGTQDNGTELRDASGTWRRADFGDGGYSVIDQNATDTLNVRMYHTYFNLPNTLVGYATVASTLQAMDNGWAFRGCQGTTSNNGITCGDAVLFYAPLERGPGSPLNSIYYGTDRLYRSDNNGILNTVVSQAPITAGVPISAIGIAPTADSVRIVGQANGGLFGTFNGSTTLTDLDPTNTVPNSYIARAVIAQTDPKIAYVTISAFNVDNVFRTTNLNAATPTWMPMVGSGINALPRVPVSSFLIDPINSNFVYAGTDIGVYMSPDGGANWAPFGTGLPRVAVFGLEMAPGRIIRAATHGKAMYEIPAALSPTASGVTVSGRVADGRGNGINRATVSITDAQGGTRQAVTDAAGNYRLEEVAAGQTYLFNIAAKGYKFQPQTVTVNEELNDLNFTANKSRRTGEFTNAASRRK